MKFIFENLNAPVNAVESVAWKSLIILALIFAALFFLRRSPAALRHWIWTVTFICLLCLPALVKLTPMLPPPAWAASSGLNNALPDSLKLIWENFSPQKPETLPPNSKMPAKPSVPQKNLPPVAPSRSPVFNGIKTVFAVWLTGLAIVLARMLATQIRLRWLTRKMRVCENAGQLEMLEKLRRDYQIKRPVRLSVSEISTSPMTWGIWRPAIALPAESARWPDERLRVVLSHELAHIKRWDCLTQEMAQLACALYWFNPLAWLAARRMRAEREKACDDFVLNAGARPAEYANHLVEIARQFSAAHFGGAVAMARPSGLESRVTAILDGRCNRNTIGKMTAVAIAFTVFGLGFLVGGCATNKSSPPKWSFKHSAVSAQLKSFVTENEAQESALAKADEKDYANENFKFKLPDCRPFFATAKKGDWQTVSNLYSDLEKGVFDPNAANKYPHGKWLQPIRETYGAIEAFAVGDEKYSRLFGDDIIQSIPAGSIYFGGTDPGRFIITALQKSHADGEPFFTLTQNALADQSYLDCLRSMYGDKIYIPTKEDSQKSFRDYVADAQLRLKAGKLKPGEDVKIDQNGRVTVGGQVAVMEINGLLVKTIFDQNPDREFYIEESFPLDWMYPYLEPHGLIFKINRQPLTELSGAIVRRDHDYWTKMIQPMIGDWLKPGTSVQEVTAFAEKIFLQRDFRGFAGDPQFVQNDYSCKMFSKERANIAGLYVWRMKNAAGSAETERMAREADFAFRQALALCPYSQEIVFQYVNFLLSQNRGADALLVAETAAKMPEIKGQDDEKQFHSLIKQLEQLQRKN